MGFFFYIGTTLLSRWANVLSNHPFPIAIGIYLCLLSFIEMSQCCQGQATTSNQGSKQSLPPVPPPASSASGVQMETQNTAPPPADNQGPSNPFYNNAHLNGANV